MVYAIAEYPIPTIVTVGRASDILVINRVASSVFATRVIEALSGPGHPAGLY